MKFNVLLSEAIGTFALVFAGCGAIIVNDLYADTLGYVGVCLVFGLVVMAMIYSVGNISGAHFNPAVTFGFFCAGRLPGRLVLPYTCSQLAGALLAAACLRFLFPEHATLGATLPAVDTVRAFVLEGIGTLLLMFVILNVATGHQEKGIMAGAAIGGTVTLIALFAGPLTGASVNPARSLGPALFSWQLQSLWLYLSAPLAGAWVASLSCRYVQGSDCCPVELEPGGESR